MSNYTHQTAPTQFFEANGIRFEKCRPDWDITTPEFKADWKRGEHSRFYHCGKPMGRYFRSKSIGNNGSNGTSAARDPRPARSCLVTRRKRQ